MSMKYNLDMTNLCQVLGLALGVGAGGIVGFITGGALLILPIAIAGGMASRFLGKGLMREQQ